MHFRDNSHFQVIDIFYVIIIRTLNPSLNTDVKLLTLFRNGVT